MINGGPHQEGCTYTALKEVAVTLGKEGIDSEIVWIGNKPVGGCIACKGCVEKGQCVFDDIVNEVRTGHMRQTVSFLGRRFTMGQLPVT